MAESIDWEGVLRRWAKPMSEQQEEQARRTAAEIRDALDQYELLPNATFDTFPQGSKRNNTDVPGDSDVDIGVVSLEGVSSRSDKSSASFSFEKAPIARTASDHELGIVTGTGVFRPNEFKNKVEAALADHFGRSNVERGDKCIKVRSSKLTLPADVVPCVPFRRYVAPNAWDEGVRIFPDSGGSIVNFPEQHYANGAHKNNSTGRRFKRMVRCLKRMENVLVDAKVLSDGVPSFLMECLLYEVPNAHFDSESYCETFVSSLRHAWYCTSDPSRCSNWREINGIKSLFKEKGGVFDRHMAADVLWRALSAVK